MYERIVLFWIWARIAVWENEIKRASKAETETNLNLRPLVKMNKENTSIVKATNVFSIIILFI